MIEVKFYCRNCQQVTTQQIISKRFTGIEKLFIPKRHKEDNVYKCASCGQVTTD